MRAPLSALAVTLLIASGCGGDDDGPTTPSPPTTTQAAPSTAVPETTPPARERRGERRERTPESLADCVREAKGVSDVLVKGRDSEDAQFFGELVGGRVEVLGVTISGVSGEVTLVLLASEADAARSVATAGGGGSVPRAIGRAVVIAPAGARVAGVEDCLRASGYA